MHRCPFAVPIALAALAWTCALAPPATAEAARRPDRTPAPASGARSPAKAGPAGSAVPRLRAPQDSAPKLQRIRPPKGADREDAGMDVDDLLIDPSELDDPGRGEKSWVEKEEGQPAEGGDSGDAEAGAEAPPATKRKPGSPTSRRQRREGPARESDRPADPADAEAGRVSIDSEPGEEPPQETAGSAAARPSVQDSSALPSSSLPPASPATEPGPVVIRGLPPRPEDAEMAAWHRRYRAAVAPLKAAIGAVVDADSAERPEHAVPACRRLAVELAAPEVAKLLPVPDLAVDLHWKRALGQLDASAGACRAGSYARTAYHLHEAGLALAQMRLALRRWGLAP